MERGIVRDLLAAVPSEFGPGPLKIRSRGQGNDPPDCEVETASGVLIGIEVSELVDAKHAGGSPTQWAEWDALKLREMVGARLVRKDQAAHIKGGPYARYVLALFTDEPLLSAPALRKHLENDSFGPFRLITDAWILSAPFPGEPNVPLKLNLVRSDAA
jgi:hypothetical protein